MDHGVGLSTMTLRHGARNLAPFLMLVVSQVVLVEPLFCQSDSRAVCASRLVVTLWNENYGHFRAVSALASALDATTDSRFTNMMAISCKKQVILRTLLSQSHIYD